MRHHARCCAYLRHRDPVAMNVNVDDVRPGHLTAPSSPDTMLALGASNKSNLLAFVIFAVRLVASLLHTPDTRSGAGSR
jgi:hypothetical protein